MSHLPQTFGRKDLEGTGGYSTSFILDGGFKYFLFLPLLGEDSHFDVHIFQMG